MSNYNKCPGCKKLVGSNHDCTPIYFKIAGRCEAWKKGYHDGNPQSFAESVASKYFSYEPCAHNTFELKILIERDDEEFEFIVTAKERVEFIASEVKP